MGRGKIEIKRIENATNKQVTYSKRRAGIMKKARELTVLCDAEVSLIMVSSTGKCCDYVSPSLTQKQFFDKYQRTVGVDLWQSQYNKMQDHLNKLEEMNKKLRREIGQRIGDQDLEGMSFNELHGLEQDLENSAKLIRLRKFNQLSTQTETTKKKVIKLKNMEEIHGNLLQEQEERLEGQYALANREVVSTLTNGGLHVFAYRLRPSHPNLHDDDGGYGMHDLRLA
ncbi:hypothetical protein IFM89_037641 [Coptis chinensis]|uniref:Uncharacterized protein n=1 Tax=Coptis chinensis TaxID=261450 RepID=A0A835M8E8_9MAGN|nr:hypothetical protein IFM89_037641 [Coptis chinensis]